jgi:hypothetical protein
MEASMKVVKSHYLKRDLPQLAQTRITSSEAEWVLWVSGGMYLQ